MSTDIRPLREGELDGIAGGSNPCHSDPERCGDRKGPWNQEAMIAWNNLCAQNFGRLFN